MLTRGINARDEISKGRVLRNTKKVEHIAIDFMKSSIGASGILFTLAFLGFVFPGFIYFSILISPIFYYLWANKRVSLPLKMPRHSNVIDDNEISLINNKPTNADGTYFLGNELDTREEVWLTKREICTHTMVLATTGGGKTEALVSLAVNSLAQGSGALLADGKADVSLFIKFYSLVKMCGREDDLLILNYNTGNRDISFDRLDQKVSNNTNPFSFGSSGSVTQLLVGLMSDGDSKGDFWKDRAISLVESVLPPLVWLRDKRGLLLDVSVIREYLNLKRILELRKITEMPIGLQDSLRAYCENLAGWNEKKGAAQSDTTLEQHGYLQMQFTRTLGSLGDIYGHIFRTPLGEVDMLDVITNRRIVLVMLPALEKAPPELANLGRIVVAMVKNMMAAALGDQFEGNISQLTQDRFTNSDNFFQTIFDEYGYYAVDGAAVMPAQARSLNMAMAFCSQDFNSLMKSGEANAKAILSNCNTKIFGKCEDGGVTFNILKEQVGEMMVTKTTDFSKNDGFFGGYSPSGDARAQMESRANIQDLKDLKEGKMYILFGSKMILTDMFYANPPDAKMLRVNEFVRIKAPSDKVLLEIEEQLSNFNNKVQSEEFVQEMAEVNFSRDIEMIEKILYDHNHLNPFERSMATVALYDAINVELSERGLAPVENETFDYPEDGLVGQSQEDGKKNNISTVSLFRDEPDPNAPIDMNAIGSLTDSMITTSVLDPLTETSRLVEQSVIDDDELDSEEFRNNYQQGLVNDGKLNADELRNMATNIGVGLGESIQDASKESSAIIQEMEDAIDYPESSIEQIVVSEFESALDGLSDLIKESSTQNSDED